MDFYSRQEAARSHTRWLVVSFFLSLLAVALALDLVLFTFLGSSRAGHSLVSPLQYARQFPGLALFSTLLIMGVLGLASLYKSMELRGGGGVVARSLGGIRVERDTSDLKLKRLLNVVEEMAIASGVPMPEVYVLEQESGINAFAAGHTPANAAVTVTQGALDRLSRDELQGVIGHEFSHILNGDMRLNIQLMGWVFGLFVIALIGRTIVQDSPRNRKSSNGVVALGIAVLVLGYVGLFAGRILQAAVSRQRERLADASGVQFTRNPEGLKGALVKIAALPEGSQLNSADAEQAAHMFFAEGLSRMFATHPPLLERIRELDPQFDPSEIERAAAEPDQDPSAAEFATGGKMAGVGAVIGGPAGPMPPGGATMSGVVAAPTGGAAPVGAVAIRAAAGSVPALGTGAAFAGPGVTGASRAQQVATQVGRPETAHILQAQALRLALPDTLREFTQSTGRAQALVLALLISPDRDVRERQLALLGKALGPGSLQALQQVLAVAQDLSPALRLPALQQIFPALRRSTPAQRQTLARLVAELIHADARIDVFEFCLAKLLETLLTDELSARVPHGTLSLEQSQAEVGVLFATIAQLGAQDERAARMAYEAGISTVLPMRRPAYVSAEDWPRSLGDALSRLEQLHPFAKKVVIEGLVKTIGNDGVMTEPEAELLRTVCALLHCPLPPLLPEVA